MRPKTDLVRLPGAKNLVPIGRDYTLAELAESSLEAIATDVYDGDDIQYMGMRRIDAAILSLARDSTEDSSARTEFLNRTLGMPKQRVDSTNVNLTLTGFLGQLAAEEEEGEIIDAG